MSIRLSVRILLHTTSASGCAQSIVAAVVSIGHCLHALYTDQLADNNQQVSMYARMDVTATAQSRIGGNNQIYDCSALK